MFRILVRERKKKDRKNSYLAWPEWFEDSTASELGGVEWWYPKQCLTKLDRNILGPSPGTHGATPAGSKHRSVSCTQRRWWTPWWLCMSWRSHRLTRLQPDTASFATAGGKTSGRTVWPIIAQWGTLIGKCTTLSWRSRTPTLLSTSDLGHSWTAGPQHGYYIYSQR